MKITMINTVAIEDDITIYGLGDDSVLYEWLGSKRKWIVAGSMLDKENWKAK